MKSMLPDVTRRVLTARNFCGHIVGTTNYAHMLTIKQIDAAKPKEKSYRLPDSGSLFLCVPPTGQKGLGLRASFIGFILSGKGSRRFGFFLSGVGGGLCELDHLISILWTYLVP